MSKKFVETKKKIKKNNKIIIKKNKNEYTISVLHELSTASISDISSQKGTICD